MKKKILFAVLAVCILILNSVYIQAETKSEDISIKVITGLNIMSYDENGDFCEDEPITREDFVITALRLLGTGEVSTSQVAAVYKDVLYDRWSYPYIMKATEIGIIEGDENSMFYPGNNITADEANRIIVTLLGYADLAEANGGYTVGYNQLISGLGIQAKFGSCEITRADAARLFYDALDTEMMMYSLNGDGMTKTGATILSEKLKVEKAEGIVTANSTTGIYSKGARTKKGAVEITDGSYKEIFSVADNEELLGCYVEYYCYTDDIGDRSIITMVPVKNKSLVVKASELEDNTTNEKIEYTPDNSNSKKYETVDADVPVMYNGVFKTFAGFADRDIFNIYAGEIEIIYHKNEITLIKIREFNDYIVNMKSEKNGITKLYFEENRYNTGSMELDPEETAVTVVFRDTAAELSDIKSNDVISVAVSEMEGGVPIAVEMRISRDIAEAQADAVDDEYITINGAEYKKAYSLKELPKVGESGTFYINCYNEVAYYKKGIYTGICYGYLTFLFEREDTSDLNYCEYKLLTPDGEFLRLTSGSTVRINGEKVKYDNVLNLLSKNQLIQYKLAPDGRIKEINTAKRKGDDYGYIGFSEDEFTVDSKRGIRYTYKSSPPVSFSATDSLTGVYTAFLVTPETVVYDVSDGVADEYYVGKAVDFFNEGMAYTVDVYDNNEFMQTPVVVYLGDVSSTEKVGWNNPAFVIEKIKQTLDEDNETVYEINGFEKGEKKTLYMNSSDIIDEGGTGVVLSKIKKGSVIQYTTDLKGKVDYYRLLYSPGLATISQKAWKGSDINSQLTTFLGNIYTKTDNSLTFTFDGGKAISAYSAVGTNVYIYDSAEATVETAPFEEIGTYKETSQGADLVFMKMYKGNITDIVIIR